LLSLTLLFDFLLCDFDALLPDHLRWVQDIYTVTETRHSYLFGSFAVFFWNSGVFIPVPP